MDQQPRPPRALRDRRWERNRDLLYDEYPEFLNPRRRAIWRELNRANTRYITRLFLWWLTVDYLVIGAGTQLLNLWYLPGAEPVNIAKVATALLITWTLNGAYLVTCALLPWLYNDEACMPLYCKWFTLAVPACFLQEFLVCFIHELFPYAEDVNAFYIIAHVVTLLSLVLFSFIKCLLIIPLCGAILAKIWFFVEEHFY